MDVRKEIEGFCKLNGLDDVDAVIDECLRCGFDILKYGVSPQDNFNIERQLEHEDKKPKTTNRRKQSVEIPKDVSKRTEEKKVEPNEKEKEVLVETPKVKVRKIKISKK